MCFSFRLIFSEVSIVINRMHKPAHHHRSSSSLHIQKLHRRQIMLQIGQESKQTSSLHISNRLSKKIEEKMRMSQCMKDLMLQSEANLKGGRSMSRFNPSFTNSQKPLDSRFRKKAKGFKQSQRQIINFKSKTLPQQYQQGKMERKISEIIIIQNEGFNKSGEELVYSRVIKPKKQKQWITFNNNFVVNRCWNELQKKSKIRKESLAKIRENRINMLMRQNFESDQNTEDNNEVKEDINTEMTESNASKIKKSFQSTDKWRFFKKYNNLISTYTSPSSTPGYLQQEEFRQTQKNLAAQALETNFIDYLDHKKKRKNFLNHLNRELIEGEDFVKLYSFLKGGYNLDPYDVDGDVVSLKRFNEAKDAFATIDDLYKIIKEECIQGQYEQNQTPPNDSRSFKSLVQINELYGKIPYSQLLKLMKQKKVVR